MLVPSAETSPCGECRYCGRWGHRAVDCRVKERDFRLGWTRGSWSNQGSKGRGGKGQRPKGGKGKGKGEKGGKGKGKGKGKMQKGMYWRWHNHKDEKGGKGNGKGLGKMQVHEVADQEEYDRKPYNKEETQWVDEQEMQKPIFKGEGAVEVVQKKDRKTILEPWIFAMIVEDEGRQSDKDKGRQPGKDEGRQPDKNQGRRPGENEGRQLGENKGRQPNAEDKGRQLEKEKGEQSREDERCGQLNAGLRQRDGIINFWISW